MEQTLVDITKALSERNICWAVGGSLLLAQFGFASKPRDIDLVVGLDDIAKADAILSAMGQKRAAKNSAAYETVQFIEYHINSIDVDVMAGLAIVHGAGVYHHCFTHNTTVQHMRIADATVPFMTLEDWYVIYQLIPKREAKVKAIMRYLQTNGVQYPQQLQQALAGCLPQSVRQNVQKLLRA